jgi:beta-lactamase regulating signal transducer with metallopeptidase domain
VTDWLLGTLLATSVLTMLVLVVREPVRRRFGSRVAYGLWLIPAARLVMPPLTQTVQRRVPAADFAWHPLVQPVSGERLLLANVADAPSLFDRAGGLPSVALALWLMVALCLFLSRFIAFHRDRRAILAVSEDLGRIGSVRIVASSEIISPVAFGILDRVIAVPADFHASYDARERHLALEHELAHHRSGDLVANLFAFVLLCLQWFNPLAWVAHAAFRFDQEAACDARVLDKAAADDRADYGRTIARAASGRALLFASALDRRNSLHRRLQSMLNNPNPRQRLAGRLLVGVAIAVALPVTASRAVHFVDVPIVAAPMPTGSAERAAVASTRVSAPAAALAQSAAVAQAAPQRDARSSPSSDLTITSADRITINGKTKGWEELTPSEKDEVRRAVAEARKALANTHIDSQRIMQDVARATSQIRTGEMQRDLARAQASMAEAVRNLDANAGNLGRGAEDSARIRAAVRESLRNAERIDLQAINRSIAALDPDEIAKSLAGADDAMRAAREELDRLEVRIRQDPK